MTPIIPSLSPLFEFLLPRNISGTDFGTGYGGTVCGFHTRPIETKKQVKRSFQQKWLPLYTNRSFVFVLVICSKINFE